MSGEGWRWWRGGKERQVRQGTTGCSQGRRARPCKTDGPVLARTTAPRVELQRACTAGERLREVVMRPRGEKFPCALAVRRAGAVGGEPCGGVAGGRGRRGGGRRGGAPAGGAPGARASSERVWKKLVSSPRGAGDETRFVSRSLGTIPAIAVINYGSSASSDEQDVESTHTRHRRRSSAVGSKAGRRRRARATPCTPRGNKCGSAEVRHSARPPPPRVPTL